MAKTSPNDITNWEQRWDNDPANGLPFDGDKVQDFLKSQFGSKVGYWCWSTSVDENNFYHLWGFATEDAKTEYVADPVGNADLLLVNEALPISGVTKTEKNVEEYLEYPLLKTVTSNYTTKNGATIEWGGGNVSESSNAENRIYESVKLHVGDKISFTITASNKISVLSAPKSSTQWFPLVRGTDGSAPAQYEFTTNRELDVMISGYGTLSDVVITRRKIIDYTSDGLGKITDVTNEMIAGGYYDFSSVNIGDTITPSVTEKNTTCHAVIDCTDCDAIIVYLCCRNMTQGIVFADDNNECLYIPNEVVKNSNKSSLYVRYDVPEGATKCYVSCDQLDTSSQVAYYFVGKFYKSENAGEVSVKYFNAKGDGVTDDTDAIQLAVASGARKVFIPEGKYKITRTIHIPTGVTVEGEGMKKTIIIPIMPSTLINTPYSMITYRNSDNLQVIFETMNGSKDIKFRAFCIDGTDGGCCDSCQMVALSVHNTENCRVEDVALKNINYDTEKRTNLTLHTIWGQNLYIFNSKNVIVDGGVFTGGGYENIGTENSQHIVIQNAYFGDAWRVSVQFHQGSDNIIFRNNKVEQLCTSSQSVLMLHGRPGEKNVSNIVIDGNELIGRTNSVTDKRGGINNIYGCEHNVRITNNSIDVDHCAISDANEGYGSSENGIPENWVIMGNMIKTTGKGVICERGKNWIFKDNVIDAAQSAVTMNVSDYIFKDNILVTDKTKTLKGTEYTD